MLSVSLESCGHPHFFKMPVSSSFLLFATSGQQSRILPRFVLIPFLSQVSRCVSVFLPVSVVHVGFYLYRPTKTLAKSNIYARQFFVFLLSFLMSSSQLSEKCKHGRRLYICKECKPHHGRICEHNRRRTLCKECGILKSP